MSQCQVRLPSRYARRRQVHQARDSRPAMIFGISYTAIARDLRCAVSQPVGFDEARRRCPTTVPGRRNRAVDRVISIFLLGLTLPSPKSKKVGQSMKRRRALTEPDRSSGSPAGNAVSRKIIAKNGVPPGLLVKLAR
jgi:hypothetical protein